MTVTALPELPSGTAARIVRLDDPESRHAEHLGNFGIAPGTRIVLRQKHPTFVIEIGGTLLALERAVARTLVVETLPE